MSFMHYHDTYELYYVLSGSRDYFIGNEFFTASDGDFVFVPKGTIHRTDGKGATRILIYFSDSFLLNYFSQDIVNMILSDFKPCVYHPAQEDSKHFQSIIKTLLNEYTTQKNNKKYTDNTMIAAYLYDLLFSFTYKKSTFTTKNITNERISDIIKYIDDNYQNIDSIDTIAKHFFISKYHLCRIFNEYLGLSLITYLNIVKIKTACEMIKSENRKMVDIAMACGFNSSAYFCNVFKQEMGISPKDYKSLNKK